jgi:hypothetical protein
MENRAVRIRRSKNRLSDQRARTTLTVADLHDLPPGGKDACLHQVKGGCSKEYVVTLSRMQRPFGRPPPRRRYGAAAMFKSARDYCPWGTSSTRRFWARPSSVALVATNWVLP